jgi:hypothetical protein
VNPKTFDSEAGFAGGAPKRIIGMVLIQVFVEYAIGRTGLSTEESARAGTTEARSKTNTEDRPVIIDCRTPARIRASRIGRRNPCELNERKAEVFHTKVLKNRSVVLHRSRFSLQSPHVTPDSAF